MMSTTMTSEEQRVVKQQILAAFEHGSSVSDLLNTASVPLHRATVYRLHQRFQTDPETALADGRQGVNLEIPWAESCEFHGRQNEQEDAGTVLRLSQKKALSALLAVPGFLRTPPHNDQDSAHGMALTQSR